MGGASEPDDKKNWLNLGWRKRYAICCRGTFLAIAMASSLDAQFGACLAPGRCSQEEADLQPLTMFILRQDTASRITDLITISQKDPQRFPCFPFDDFTILYVVDSKGQIIVAIEEAALPRHSQRSKLFPLPKVLHEEYRTQNPPLYSKLGHPALVGAQPARIGGEIRCDFGRKPPGWYITNGSGRYGVNLGRTPQQLINVAAEFAKYGISLTHLFL